MGRHPGQVSVLALFESLSSLDFIPVNLAAITVLGILFVFEKLFCFPAISYL